MRRSVGVALLLVALVVLGAPASAGAVEPEQAVGGAGSKWISGDLLTQIGENCAVLGSPYTETMVSGIASYGGVSGVPVVNQHYWTAFLVSVPGDPCGTGSSSIETDLVLPPNTSVDTSRQIRCFGEPSGASTFVELTGQSWSFDGYSGPYCPTAATPSALHSGGLSFGFRPIATGQLFWIFVPVISTAPLVGAGTSPPDGFRWLTDATGVYANPGLSTVWANVFAAPSGSEPFIYFAHEPAIPFWDGTASAGPPDIRNRVEFFANLYSAGHGGELCFEIIRLPSTPLVKCSEDASLGWKGAVPAGEPDLFQVFGEGASRGPNGGYVPAAYDTPLWGQEMKIVWKFSYSGGEVHKEATFRTLSGPDSDGDGVPDSLDACPTVKGTLSNGCMPAVQTDPDGDGVFGAADLCPTVNGLGALNGCPGGIVPGPPAPSSGAPSVTTTTTPAPQLISPPTVSRHKATAAAVGGHVVVGTGLTVGCPAGGPSCTVTLSGTVSGTQAKGASAKAKSVIVGTLRTTIPAGRTLALSLRLNGKGAALLKKHRKLKIALAGTASAGGGPSTRLSSTITVAYPPSRHKRH